MRSYPEHRACNMASSALRETCTTVDPTDCCSKLRISSATDFSPYITSVGLYDNDYNLLAVAKLTKPMKKPTDLPLTFKVSIDV